MNDKTDPQALYWKKYMSLLLAALLVLGGAHLLVAGVFQIDLIQRILGRSLAAKAVYALFGIAALTFAFSRDYYLPFLGDAVFPIGLLTKKTPQSANEVYTIQVPPKSTVVYWAAEPAREGAAIQSWEGAYGLTENAGVAIADEDGNAVLRVRGHPQPYTVPMKGRIEPHIHFRVNTGSSMLGPVHTLFVDSNRIEPFTSTI